MHRISTVTSLTFLAIVGTSAANAADLPQPRVYQKAPAYQTYVAPFTWQGFYVGINGGYGWATSDLASGGSTSTAHPKGALVGTTIGYNFQSANIVYGLEGDLDYSWMRGSTDTAPCAGCEVRNFYFGTARARLGYAFDRWMPYITGGAAFGDIQTSTPDGGSRHENKVGWTAGGGVEYAFAIPNWSAKIEYLYADLGTANCDAAYCGTSTDVTFKENVVRLGVNYRY
jgi:outer membrane immunogenic protein